MREHPVRRPTRIPGYDYASAGMYFITIFSSSEIRVLGSLKTERCS